MKSTEKYLLAFSLIFNALAGFPQITMSSGGATRAVVVGISNYQKEEIPDLQFAHRDAEAFANFLESPGGGNLAGENVRLLCNEKATTAQFAAALEWLVRESREGDLAIIYFSGHGDVETLTRSQNGYLLTYDSPPVTYVAGAIPVSFLQDIVSTLSLEKKAKVVLITDACHAGKLAGSNVKGSQATTSNMARQFANEVKILSCQPEEYSNESVKWGGGRGVFSWYLVNGLYGLADQNTDLVVNLLEINRFLEDKVPADVAPASQTPMVFGNRGEALATVDEATFAQVKEWVSNPSQPMGFVKKTAQKSVGSRDSIPLPLAAKSALNDAETALRKGLLLEPKEKSAVELYQKLRREAPTHPLTHRFAGDLAAELNARGQQIFNNAILQQTGKPLGIAPDFKDKILLGKQFFEKTALVLGSKNFQIKALRAKVIFLDGLLAVDNYKKQNLSPDPKPLVELAEKALENYPEATYLHVLLGELYTWGLGDAERGLAAFNRAQALSPNWDAIYSGITMATERLNTTAHPGLHDERVGSGGEKNELASQTEIAERILFSGNEAAAATMFQKIEQKFPKESVAQANMALALALQGDVDAAETKLLNLLAANPNELAIYSNLIYLYLLLETPAQTEDYSKKALQKWAHSPVALYDAARIWAAKGKEKEATEKVLEALENGYLYPERLKTDKAFAKLRQSQNFKQAVSGYVQL